MSNGTGPSWRKVDWVTLAVAGVIAFLSTLAVGGVTGVLGYGKSITSIETRLAAVEKGDQIKALENSMAERVFALEGRVDELKSAEVSATAINNVLSDYGTEIRQLEASVDSICQRLSATETLVNVSPSLSESLASLRERLATLEVRLKAEAAAQQ
jgi:hypothetical protein